MDMTLYIMISVFLTDEGKWVMQWLNQICKKMHIVIFPCFLADKVLYSKNDNYSLYIAEFIPQILAYVLSVVISTESCSSRISRNNLM